MSIQHEELLRRLRRLSKALNTYCTHINYGGCGVMAGIAGEFLHKLGVEVEIVTPTNRWGDYVSPAEARNNLPPDWETVWDWNANGLSSGHLAVRFKSGGRTYTWDSDGTRNRVQCFGKGMRTRAGYKFGGGLTVEECQRMSADPRGWNSTFNREQIPLMRNLTEHHLYFGIA